MKLRHQSFRSLSSRPSVANFKVQDKLADIKQRGQDKPLSISKIYLRYRYKVQQNKALRPKSVHQEFHISQGGMDHTHVFKDFEQLYEPSPKRKKLKLINARQLGVRSISSRQVSTEISPDKSGMRSYMNNQISYSQISQNGMNLDIELQGQINNGFDEKQQSINRHLSYLKAHFLKNLQSTTDQEKNAVLRSFRKYKQSKYIISNSAKEYRQRTINQRFYKTLKSLKNTEFSNQSIKQNQMWLYIANFILVALMIEYSLSKISPIIESKITPSPELQQLFTRDDLPNLQRWRLYLVGFFLMIPRILVQVIMIVITWILIKLCTIGIQVNRPLPPITRSLVKLICKFTVRVYLLSLGFWYIEEHGQEDPNAIVIAANHTSFIDIMYFMQSQELPSFISKHTVQNYYFIGSIAKAISCVFVQRNGSHTNALQVVTQRQNDISNNLGYPKLLVFPEGTTTNGRGLMPFKIGGFASRLPVQPVALQYPYKHFSPALDIIDTISLCILLSCQIFNRLKVTRLPLARSGDKNPAEFAESVRIQLANHLQVPLVDTNFEKKTEYLNALFGKVKDF